MDDYYYIAPDHEFDLIMCWVEEPSQIYESSSIQPQFHIDISDIDIDSMEIRLEPYTLTSNSDCGSLEYTLEISSFLDQGGAPVDAANILQI